MMLSSEERSEIVSALFDWAEFSPDEPAIGFLDELFTPKQVATAIADGTPEGEELLKLIEYGVRQEGLASVLYRFRTQVMND